MLHSYALNDNVLKQLGIWIDVESKSRESQNEKQLFYFYIKLDIFTWYFCILKTQKWQNLQGIMLYNVNIVKQQITLHDILIRTQVNILYWVAYLYVLQTWTLPFMCTSFIFWSCCFLHCTFFPTRLVFLFCFLVIFFATIILGPFCSGCYKNLCGWIKYS